MATYYYYTKAEYIIKNIRDSRIKVSYISGVDDPNEFVSRMKKRGVNMPADLVKTRVGQGLASTWGIVSFSEDWNIPAMWGLYADKFQGGVMCFEYDNDDFITKVEYTAKRAITTTDTRHVLDAEEFDNFVRYKDTSWSFQKEHRLVLPINSIYFCSDDNFIFLPISNRSPNDIKMHSKSGCSKLEDTLTDVKYKVRPKLKKIICGPEMPRDKVALLNLVRQEFELRESCRVEIEMTTYSKSNFKLEVSNLI